MDSQVAFSWVVVIAVACAALVGLAILLSVCRAHWKTMSIAASAVTFAMIGALLITSPKWTQIAFEIGNMKIQIAKAEELQRHFVAVKAERDSLLSKVAELDAEKASVQTAVVKAFAAATEAKTLPYTPDKWDGVATELNNALSAWQ